MEKPRTPVRCVICDRYRLICLLIAKNATTTLRETLGNSNYGGYELRYSEIDKRIRDEYLTFAVLREPVTRLLSAYQEISYRHDHGLLQNLKKDFFSMNDSPERFAAFLDTLQPPDWDPHVRRQVDYLQDVRVDLFTCVEQLQEGITALFDRLGMGSCPILPVRRSRKERLITGEYARFVLDRNDIDRETVSRITQIYSDDVSLYSRHFEI
jgi:hypothetical protein